MGSATEKTEKRFGAQLAKHYQEAFNMALLRQIFLTNEPTLHTQSLTFPVTTVGLFPVNVNRISNMHHIVSLNQMFILRPITVAKGTKYFHWTNFSPETIQVRIIKNIWAEKE